MFGFNETSYKEYKKNFLKTVVFQISFNKIDKFSEKKDAIIENFISSFPRVATPSGLEISINNNETPIVSHSKNDSIIEMKSDSGQKVLNITDSAFSITISSREYKSYLGLKNDLNKLQDFFDLCKIIEIYRVAIRKINIVQTNNSQNAPDVIKIVLNEHLIGDSTYLPKSEFIKQNLHLLHFNNEGYNLILKYGLNVPQIPEQDIAEIIIDIDLFNNDIIPITELYRVSDKINKEIFNIFNWSISDTFLFYLNE